MVIEARHEYLTANGWRALVTWAGPLGCSGVVMHADETHKRSMLWLADGRVDPNYHDLFDRRFRIVDVWDEADSLPNPTPPGPPEHYSARQRHLWYVMRYGQRD